MSSSKQSGTKVVTQNREPWSEQKPYLTEGFQRAQSDMLNKPMKYYPNSMVVPFSPTTEQGLGQTEARALAGSPVLRNAQQNIADTAGGAYLGPNPYLQGAIDAASEGVTRNYQKAVSPGIDSLASASGRYGSGMQKSMHDDAQLNLANQLRDMSAGMTAQNYAQERANQMGASQMAPGLAQADYQDIQALLDVGKAREGQAGAELQDDAARYYHEQQAPRDALSDYMSMVAGGQFGGSTTSTEPIYSNTGMNLLGGGLGLASAAGSLFGARGPWSAGGMFGG